MGHKKSSEYISDSNELKAKKKALLGDDYDIDNIPTTASFDIKADRQYLDGKKVHIEDVAGQDIVVFDAKITNSKFRDELSGEQKEILVLQFGFVDEGLETTYMLFSGAVYLINYIRQFKEKSLDFPFRTTIKKHGKTYTFT